MSEQIIDGTGTGKKVRVDNANRLHTHSVNETLIEYAASQGDSYNINTGTINLTSATESALLYFKNNGNNDVHIASVGYLIGNSTGGTGDLQTKVIKNPTTGTIISGAVNVGINSNKNAGSSKVMDIDAFKGAEGNTFTDGTDFYYSLLSGAAKTYVIATGTVVLPKGSSIGVSVTPQASNTSMDVQIFMSVTEYKLDI
jgi:hypothetical protein